MGVFSANKMMCSLPSGFSAQTWRIYLLPWSQHNHVGAPVTANLLPSTGLPLQVLFPVLSCGAACSRSGCFEIPLQSNGDQLRWTGQAAPKRELQGPQRGGPLPRKGPGQVFIFSCKVCKIICFHHNQWSLWTLPSTQLIPTAPHLRGVWCGADPGKEKLRWE